MFQADLILQQQVRAVEHDQFVVTWASVDSANRQSFFATVCSSPTLACSPPVVVARDQLVAQGFQFEMDHEGRGLATWATIEASGFAGHMVMITATWP
jgi:hypothetical protein